MRKLLCLVFCFLFICGCSQKPEEKKPITVIKYSNKSLNATVVPN